MRAPVVALVFVALELVACNREKELRNRECADFANWSNNAGQPLSASVSEAEKRAADTGAKQAAVCRKLAEGARKSSQATVPFTDPYVKDLGARRLKVFEGVATALDHQADAWAKDDKDALKLAVEEELKAQAGGKAVLDEWLAKCRM